MRWTDPTDEQIAAWDEWIAERPPEISEVAHHYRLDPWTMYRLKTTGQRCQLLAFSEAECVDDVTVRIYAEHAGLGPITGVEVFGINPRDLEPWDGDARPEWVCEETPPGEVNIGGAMFTAGPGISWRLVSAGADTTTVRFTAEAAHWGPADDDPS